MLLLLLFFDKKAQFTSGLQILTYRKIPKISPGAYLFIYNSQLFFKGLFSGVIFGGAYIQRVYLGRQIWVSKSIRLAL